MNSDGQIDRVDRIRSALGTYEGDLLRYARKITGDLERARDVVQETFLRLCKQDIAELDGHLAEWLFTVCRNKALDVRRKESRMSTMAETNFLEENKPSDEPSKALEVEDETMKVMSHLEKLPDNQQEVIRLKFQNGLKYKEISSVTGLSVSNVGFLIHRGLKTLREKLRKELAADL